MVWNQDTHMAKGDVGGKTNLSSERVIKGIPLCRKQFIYLFLISSS